MGLTPEQMQELQELSEAVTHLDANIQELHASTVILALMGEHPITLAAQCQPGEIKWMFGAPGYPHPDNIGDLIATARETGAWLHPRIGEIPHF